VPSTLSVAFSSLYAESQVLTHSSCISSNDVLLIRTKKTGTETEAAVEKDFVAASSVLSVLPQEPTLPVYAPLFWCLMLPCLSNERLV